MCNLWKYGMSLLLLLAVATSYPVATNAEEFTVDKRVITLPLEYTDAGMIDVSKESVISFVDNDHTLNGLTDSVQGYYQVPAQVSAGKNNLKIAVAYSDLLLKDSTLTVSIDGKPVKSFAIDISKTRTTLTVPLTGEAIIPGFHNVTITFNGHLTENMCVDEDTAANWLTVLAESAIYLNTEDIGEVTKGLADYPYPFIQYDRDDPVQAVIVVPNNPSDEILTAALKVSSYLKNQLDANQLVKVLEEKAVKKVSSHLIAIGAVDDWDGLVKDMMMSAKVEVDADDILLSNYVMQFQDVSKQLLLITANEKQVISDNIGLVTNEQFIAQLDGAELAVNALPEIEPVEINPRHLLKSFDVPDLTLTGSDRSTLNYFFDIPTYADLYGEMSMHLKVKVSETLFPHEKYASNRDEAELVVYINDVPHSVRVHNLRATDDEGVYEVDLPVQSKLLREQPYLSLRFQANGLSEHDYCVKPNDDNWIFIQKDSYLTIPTVDKNADPSFQTWPAPFVTSAEAKETVVIYPNELTDTSLRQLQYVANNLGARGNIAGLQFVMEENVIAELLRTRDVILIGNPYEYKSLQNFSENLLVEQAGVGHLNVLPFGFMAETSSHIGWMQDSVWDASQLMAVFSEVNAGEDEGKAQVTPRLIDFANETSIHTDIIVESKNGAFFTRSMVEKKKDAIIEQDEAEKIKGEFEGNRWLLYGFGGVILLSMVVLAYYIRRKSRSKRKE